MEFKKNELIDRTLNEYYNTFSQTLDTGDYVPEKFNKKVHKYIYLNLAKKFKEIEVYHLLYLQEQGFILDVFAKLKIHFSGLKPLFEKERQEEKEKELKKQERRKALKEKKEKESALKHS